MRSIVGKLSVAAAITVCGIGLALVPSSLAGAAAPTCSGTMTGTVSGPLVVVGGSVCTLNNATVTGSVIVQPNGTLITKNAVIRGSVLADKALQIKLSGGSIDQSLVVNGLSDSGAKVSKSCGVTIGGSVTIKSIAEGVAGNNEFDFGDDAGGCPGNTVRGSVTLAFNSAETEVDLNAITGSLAVAGNTGPMDISGNTIGGNLTCSLTGGADGLNRPKDDEAPNVVTGVFNCDLNTAP